MKVEVVVLGSPESLIVCTVSLEVKQHWTWTRLSISVYVLASKHRLSISVYVLANKPHFFSSRISWQALWGAFHGTSSIQWHATYLCVQGKEEREEEKKWWGMKQCSHDIIKFRRLYVQICLTSYDTIYFAGSAHIWCGTAVDSVSIGTAAGHLKKKNPLTKDFITKKAHFVGIFYMLKIKRVFQWMHTHCFIQKWKWIFFFFFFFIGGMPCQMPCIWHFYNASLTESCWVNIKSK